MMRRSRRGYSAATSLPL